MEECVRVFPGLPDNAVRGLNVAADRSRLWAGYLWQHGFRLVTALLVALVIFTAARQVPSSGSKATPALVPANTYVSDAPKPIDWPQQYHWLSKRGRAKYEPLSTRIAPPEGYTRVEVASGSFADWLRHLPVGAKERPVTNSRKQTVYQPGDPRLAAVIDLQPGAGNLLLSPAMMVRLRAEYLWAANQSEQLAFHYTSGHLAKWPEWAAGSRPTVHGKQVAFKKDRPEDHSRDNFCGFLETVFRYTTVYSLLQDMDKTESPSIAAGDVFITTGKGGHAVMVLDVAANKEGRVKVLLGQGGNPAQTFHVLRAEDGDAWFKVSPTNGIRVNEKLTLRMKDLRHWKS